MGCEGDIYFSKITEGFHLIEDLHPILKIVNPVAILPVQTRKCFDSHNLVMDQDLEYLLSSWVDEDKAQYISLGMFGIVAIDLELFEKVWDKDHWQKFPGSVNPEKTRLAWSNLTPGFWMVTKYSDNGMNNNYYRSSENITNLFKFGDKVAWEIWT